MDFDGLVERIKKFEGWRPKPYHDSLGILTIGYGFNLDHWFSYGMTEGEGEALIRAKLHQIIFTELYKFPEWAYLNEARTEIIVDMIYNIGLPKVLGFRKMRAAIRERDWAEAAKEMLSSRWARQVGLRADKLALMMLIGGESEEENGKK